MENIVVIHLSRCNKKNVFNIHEVNKLCRPNKRDKEGIYIEIEPFKRAY